MNIETFQDNQARIGSQVILAVLRQRLCTPGVPVELALAPIYEKEYRCRTNFSRAWVTESLQKFRAI